MLQNADFLVYISNQEKSFFDFDVDNPKIMLYFVISISRLKDIMINSLTKFSSHVTLFLDQEIITINNNQDLFLNFIRKTFREDGTYNSFLDEHDVFQNALIDYDKWLKRTCKSAEDNTHVIKRFWGFLAKALLKLRDRKWRSDLEWQKEFDHKKFKQDVAECREIVEHFRHKLTPAQTVYLERVYIEQTPLKKQIECRMQLSRVRKSFRKVLAD